MARSHKGAASRDLDVPRSRALDTISEMVLAIFDGDGDFRNDGSDEGCELKTWNARTTGCGELARAPCCLSARIMKADDLD